jgi:hypothetical protein
VGEKEGKVDACIVDVMDMHGMAYPSTNVCMVDDDDGD